MEEELMPTRGSIKYIDNCGGFNCVNPHRECLGCDELEPTFWDEYGEIILQFCGALLLWTLIIGSLITLGFYLVYRHKKDEHPFKHAIKRSWPWGIAVFLIPIVVVGFFLLYGYYTY